MTVERFLGKLLRNVHAGEGGLALNQPGLREAPDTISLTSSSFSEGGHLLQQCAHLLILISSRFPPHGSLEDVSARHRTGRQVKPFPLLPLPTMPRSG